jgi:hypothetical protein
MKTLKYRTKEKLKLSGAVFLLIAIPSFDSVEVPKAPPEMATVPSFCFTTRFGQEKCVQPKAPCTTDTECFQLFGF